MGNRSDIFTEKFYLTDGGLETTLIFHQGIKLNHFAAFELVNTPQGQQALESYYKPYLELASKYHTGFIFEAPTWRASPDWANKLGYSPSQLSEINKNAVKLAQSHIEKYGKNIPHILISGNIGPRGDGYRIDNLMTMAEAKDYHTPQIEAFAMANVDLVTALTITYVEEAAGIVNAAAKFKMPVVISFTLETDGKLPNGTPLSEAITKTDQLTNGYASHFMINCAHPNHFSSILSVDENWKFRIKGIRANASTKSHAELDESEELDAGDKCTLAINYKQLVQLIPSLFVFGGCCGTDYSHIEEISKTVLTDRVANISP